MIMLGHNYFMIFTLIIGDAKGFQPEVEGDLLHEIHKNEKD